MPRLEEYSTARPILGIYPSISRISFADNISDRVGVPRIAANLPQPVRHESPTKVLLHRQVNELENENQILRTENSQLKELIDNHNYKLTSLKQSHIKLEDLCKQLETVAIKYKKKAERLEEELILSSSKKSRIQEFDESMSSELEDLRSSNSALDSTLTTALTKIVDVFIDLVSIGDASWTANLRHIKFSILDYISKNSQVFTSKNQTSRLSSFIERMKQRGPKTAKNEVSEVGDVVSFEYQKIGIFDYLSEQEDSND